MPWALAIGLFFAVIGGCGAAGESKSKSAPGGGNADRSWEAPRGEANFAGDEPPGSRTLRADDSDVATTDEAARAVVAQVDGVAQQVGVGEAAVAERPAERPAAKEVPAARKPARRIIYVATVQLVVDDFGAAESAIPELVRRFDGYVSESGVVQRSGTQRGGKWVVRIPVEGYEAFLAALGDLGIPENLQQNAQDVTQEFIDLEARMANQRRLEERILKLLENNEGGIKDVIEVERELARVRLEIETMEGRLRYLRNQTALTTVTIHVREEQSYKPPQAPTFAGEIGRTWSESLRGLRLFGKGLVLIAVALAPWVAVALPFAGGAWWYWRRSHRALDL